MCSARRILRKLPSLAPNRGVKRRDHETEMTHALLPIGSFDDEPLLHQPPPERVVKGNPLQRIWIRYTDPSGQFSLGKWACESGAWRVIYTEHEYCEMLAGRIRITDEAGTSREVVAGDRFVVPAGFRGIWEVLEPASKIFAVYEASA